MRQQRADDLHCTALHCMACLGCPSASLSVAAELSFVALIAEPICGLLVDATCSVPSPP